MLSSLGYYTQVVALAQNIPHTMMILLPDESNLHQIREVLESCEEKQQMNSLEYGTLDPQIHSLSSPPGMITAGVGSW